MEADQRGVILEKGLGTEHAAEKAGHALQDQLQATSGMMKGRRDQRGYKGGRALT